MKVWSGYCVLFCMLGESVYSTISGFDISRSGDPTPLSGTIKSIGYDQ